MNCTSIQNSKNCILYAPEGNELHKVAKPLAAIPFVLEDHLPVITVQVNGRTLKLGLDTGAAVNLLDKTMLDELPATLLTNVQTEELVALDRSIIKVKTGNITETQVDGQKFGDMKYLFTDLSGIKANSALQIDGLLGWPFFQKMKCSINYKKATLYIWEK